MVLMTKLYKLAALLAVTLLMAACGSFDGEEEQGPAPLLDFDIERKFVKVWALLLVMGRAIYTTG